MTFYKYDLHRYPPYLQYRALVRPIIITAIDSRITRHLSGAKKARSIPTPKAAINSPFF